MARGFAKWIGAFFLALGVVGFFVHDLWGLFHLHTTHNVVHVLLGLWGLGASRLESTSMSFAKSAGIVYLLLGALGFFTPELFGMMHVGMSDNLIHLVVGAVATYIGFVVITPSQAASSKAA